MRHDEDQIWGDDPEERDADAVVAELAAHVPAAERRWHHHPAFVPFKAIGMFIGRNAKRVVVTIVGGLVLLVGLAGLLLPVPPGWALIVVGLGILATEYVWARRLLLKAKQVALAAKDKALRKKSPGAADSPAD
jgi:hypothetical protein